MDMVYLLLLALLTLGPFVLFVLLPGLVPWWPGSAGPLLWALAFAFTTVGRFGLGSSAATSAHI